MKYDIESHGEITVLKILEKRLIYEALDPIQQKFTDLVDEGHRIIVLDFEQVDYLDSFAVGFIMDMYRRVTSAKGRLKLSGLKPRVKKILQITRVDNVITLYDNAEEAVAALSTSQE